MRSPNQPIIYALADPRNPKLPKYIGLTTNRPLTRLRGHRHIAKKFPNLPVSKWINEMAMSGLEPQIYILEAVIPPTNAAARETAWINFFRPLGTLLNISNGYGCTGVKKIQSKLNKDITGPKLQACNEARKKPVIAVDLGMRFSSVRGAAKELGVPHQNIIAVIKNGKRIRSSHWIYADKKEIS